jgi:hypothetical protein
MSRPLIPGFPWAIELEFASDPPQVPLVVFFPVGVQLRASVRVLSRAEPNAPVLATLTTADGTIERLSDSLVRCTIPAAVSRDWRAKVVAFDLIRTDTVPDVHCGVRVEVPIFVSITETTEPRA